MAMDETSLKTLRKTPTKDPEIYKKEDIFQVGKMVNCIERHLDWEEEAKQDTNSKSFRSLEEWGHDTLKTQHQI